jgi:hypothetical protein
MRPFVVKSNNPSRRSADNRNALNIRYSKTDFFYEGQELRSNEAKEHNGKTGTKSKAHDRFFGHFNTFF